MSALRAEDLIFLYLSPEKFETVDEVMLRIRESIARQTILRRLRYLHKFGLIEKDEKSSKKQPKYKNKQMALALEISN